MNGAGGRFRLNNRGGGGGQRKDRDNDDLILFKELNRREKDQAASLLQPISDEFEVNAAGTHHSFYRIPSGKKDGSQGYEFFGGGGHGKNDYDWLKTPPATPLFPSLEMEASRPDLLVQREITVVQPLSRFAASSESGKSRTTSTTTSPPTTTKSSPSRPKMPTNRSSLTGQRPAPNVAQPVGNEVGPTLVQYGRPKPTTDHYAGPKLQPIIERATNTTTIPSSVGKSNVKPVQQPKTRGLSPGVRSNIATVAAAVAADHHSRTTIASSRPDRASSTSRIRPKPMPFGHQKTSAAATTAVPAKPRSSSSSSRPRLSSTTTTTRTTTTATNNEGNYVHNQKSRGGGTQVFGSKMVDKVMSARKSYSTTTSGIGQHLEAVQGANSVKPKAKLIAEGLGNGGDKAGNLAGAPAAGFGRILALRNMELNRDRNNRSHYNQHATRS
ncbi:unnamed protein product [Linum tenue]|uniref:Uncharacterized protein n=1 Tax=Linum tenue TaxID=586396 RepID=A0AAV0HX76_9ROSI|nr:unnamed protein product [Linum tenue]